jgi:hypothetical protein
MTIRNTATDPMSHMLVLLDGMSGGNGSAAIEAMEERGQTELVNSDRLPVDSGNNDEAFIAVGFTFGTVDPDDRLFRPATLPAGWKREGSDHAMWSYLVDQHGRRRVGVFYKAAFYDRSAHMYLNSRTSYLSTCLYDNTAPVLDDEWLSPAIAVETLGQMAEHREDEARECDEWAVKQPDNSYWPNRAAEHRTEVAKMRTLAARLATQG